MLKAPPLTPSKHSPANPYDDEAAYPPGNFPAISSHARRIWRARHTTLKVLSFQARHEGRLPAWPRHLPVRPSLIRNTVGWGDSAFSHSVTRAVVCRSCGACIVKPSSRRAWGACDRRTAGLLPRPYPPCVMTGTNVLFERSCADRKDRITGGAVSPRPENRGRSFGNRRCRVSSP